MKHIALTVGLGLTSALIIGCAEPKNEIKRPDVSELAKVSGTTMIANCESKTYPESNESLNFVLSRDQKTNGLMLYIYRTVVATSSGGSYAVSTKALWLGKLEKEVASSTPQGDPCKTAEERGFDSHQLCGPTLRKDDNVLLGYSETSGVDMLYSKTSDLLITKVRGITYVVDCAKKTLASDAL